MARRDDESLRVHGALRTALSALMSGEQDEVTGERIDVGGALLVLAR